MAARGGVNTSIATQPSGPATPLWGTCGGITTRSPGVITRVSPPTVNVSRPETMIAICCSAWWWVAASAPGSKVTKFVITASVVTGWKTSPGTSSSGVTSSVGRTNRGAAPDGSPASSKYGCSVIGPDGIGAPRGAHARAIAARPSHPDQQLGGRDLLRTERDGALAQPWRKVVVVALEAMAGDAERRRERVQLREGTVHGHVAPVLDREADVGVAAQGIDEGGQGAPGPSWRLGLAPAATFGTIPGYPHRYLESRQEAEHASRGKDPRDARGRDGFGR